MRLALYANRLATPTPTGIDRYARELITALAARDEHHVVACSTHERNRPDWLPATVDVRRVAGPRRAVHLAWCLAGRPRIDRVVGTVDAVHVTAPTFPVPTSAPLVYTVHDLMPLVRPEWFGRVHRWGFAKAIAAARDGAAAVIVDSVATADAAVATSGIDRQRISVVPLGVSKQFCSPVADADIERVTRALGVTPKSYVVYVGHVNDRKNVAVLVDALARIGEGRPALVVAGPEGRGAARVHESVERYGLRSSVRFAGFVPDGDLPPLLAGARALVHPSLHEGFGLPPLEAMAVGVPAIVADTAALPETVGDLAIVADANDADAWAGAIAALDDLDVTEARAALGQTHARSFTWEGTASATLAVYERVASRNPRRG